jgi:hypothetical protein
MSGLFIRGRGVRVRHVGVMGLRVFVPARHVPRWSHVARTEVRARTHTHRSARRINLRIRVWLQDLAPCTRCRLCMLRVLRRDCARNTVPLHLRGWPAYTRSTRMQMGGVVVGSMRGWRRVMSRRIVLCKDGPVTVSWITECRLWKPRV